MPHLEEDARRGLSAVLVGICVCWLAPLSPSRAAEIKDTVVLVESGDRAPDDTGDLSSTRLPVLYGAGRAAFTSTIRENGFLVGTGAYVAGPLGLVQLARSGEPSPDTNGNFGFMTDPPLLINGAQQAAFYNSFDNTFGGEGDSDVIVIADGSGPASIVARAGQTPPGSPGPLQALLDPSGLNRAGQVCFLAFVQGTPGVFRGDGSPGSLVSIGVTGQALPGGGSLAAILGGPAPAINAAGRVAFLAWVDEPFVDGIFVGDGTSPLVEIVRGRDATPSGNGVLSDFFGLLSNHPFNDRGEVAFVGLLDDTAGGTADNQGLFLGDGSTLVELVRRGESTPDGNGSFLNFGGLIDLDDAGRVIFRTTVTGASGGATDGLFIADRNGVEQIVRRNDPAPGGGLFADVLESSLSAAGVVFRAYVNLDNGGSTNDELGAFFYNRTGLRSIAREGDTLAGFGTVTDVLLHAASETEGIEGTADGDDGQVALRFTSGGEFLTAVWSGATLLKDGFESGDTSAWSSQVGLHSPRPLGLAAAID